MVAPQGNPAAAACLGGVAGAQGRGLARERSVRACRRVQQDIEDVLEARGYSLSRMPPETQLPRFAAFIAPIVGAITTFLSESAETPVRHGVPFPGEETLAT